MFKKKKKSSHAQEFDSLTLVIKKGTMPPN